MGLLNLAHLMRNGWKGIVLLGTGTTIIGDPSWRNTQKTQLGKDQISLNKDSIIRQIQCFFKNISIYNNVEEKDSLKIVDNFSWYKNLNMIDFLMLSGATTVNSMLSKEW